MSYSREETESLVLDIIGSLTVNNLERVEHLVDNQSNAGHLKQGSWDLVSGVCELLTEENSAKSGFTKSCDHILMKVCEVANVKELLLALLEQADRFNDDARYLSLLKPLQKCLLELPSRRGHSVALVLETLYAHISTLQKPDVQPLSGEERKLLESDDNICRIAKVLTCFLDFLEPLVEEASWRNNCESVIKQRNELLKCLLKILENPLAHLDLSKLEASNNGVFIPCGRILAETVCRQLAKLQCNFAKTLLTLRMKIEDERIKGEQKDSKVEKKMATESGDDVNNGEEEEEEEEEATPELGASVFAYLVFSEQLESDNMPQVLTQQYWLEFNLPFVTCMLGNEQWLIQEKGVQLFGSIVNRIPVGSVSSDFVSTYRVKLVLQSLLKVLCTCQSKEVSQLTLKHFTTFLWSFDSLGRHKFILYILKRSKHSGILGFCITQLKELIDRNLNSSEPDVNF